MAVITSPVTGTSISDLSVKSVMGLLYADLVKLFAGADIDTDFPELDRNYGEWGAIIKEARLAAAESHAVDPNTTSICGPYYFDLDSAYYQRWVEKVFSSEVRRVEVTKVCRGEEEYGALLAAIVNRNTEGYRDELNQEIEATFARVDASSASTDDLDAALVSISDDGAGALTLRKFTARNAAEGTGYGSYLFGGKLRASVVGGTINGTTGAITLDGYASFSRILAEVLFRAMNMKRANATYTEGSARWGARIDDLVIYVSDRFQSAMDIKYIQALFNEKGIDKLPTIRTYQGISGQTSVDGFDAIIIMDKRTINHVTRYYEADVDDIGCRKSTRFDLHIEDMIKYVPFYKAWAVLFKVNDADAALDVNIVGGEGALV